MTFAILGDHDQHRLYCTGSFTKLVTTFVTLSFLADKYDLFTLLDDEDFLDHIAVNQEAKDFLNMFQCIIGCQFTLRDVCSFYNGLPYTFDILPAELEYVDQGHAYRGHSILSEKVLLEKFRTCITMIDPNHSKFHYSEIAIIFLGYFMEKAFQVRMEDLYQQYVLKRFDLQESQFSRIKPSNVYVQDLSDKYDYPSIGIVDHGYFCYSNGYFTTLHDQKKLLEQLLTDPVFAVMTDLRHARAASNTIMNGLTVELRIVGDDLLFGYEGLSYSGCNIWAYSTKQKKGYITLSNDEDSVYTLIYDQFGYQHFDKDPSFTQSIYHHFLETKNYDGDYEPTPIPLQYVGDYRRVDINDSSLKTLFRLDSHTITIRNPELVTYDVIYDRGVYRITCKDHMHGIKVGLYQAKSGRRYMMFDGTLYYQC